LLFLERTSSSRFLCTDPLSLGPSSGFTPLLVVAGAPLTLSTPPLSLLAVESAPLDWFVDSDGSPV